MSNSPEHPLRSIYKSDDGKQFFHPTRFENMTLYGTSYNVHTGEYYGGWCCIDCGIGSLPLAAEDELSRVPPESPLGKILKSRSREKIWRHDETGSD